MIGVGSGLVATGAGVSIVDDLSCLEYFFPNVSSRPLGPRVDLSCVLLSGRNAKNRELIDRFIDAGPAERLPS